MNNLKFTRIERFMVSDKGRRITNFAYSWGAAIVIIGALFKIIHLPYANIMLSFGMGTEALIFILLGFDVPFKVYKWEEVFPVLDSKKQEDRPDFSNLAKGEIGGFVGGGSGIVGEGSGTVGGGSGVVIVGGATGQTDGTVPSGGGFASTGGGVIRAGGAQPFIPAGLNVSDEDVESLSDSIQKLSQASQQISKMAEHVNSFGQTASSLANVSETLLNSYRGISDNSEGIVNNSIDYINQMESINRNLSGLNTIYEIQLKSLSSQIDAIDKVNNSLTRIKEMYESSAGDTGKFREETEKMAQQLSALNTVYGRILNAMSANIYGNNGNRF
ncbi:MAG: gliding motility protein GldL [Bacteroidales bacterium]|nr:gliding motility protein GldL [Bacteroidales bacterium]MDD4821202.1 gliding motility protein GldL [Bacteroidales bacterium]